MVGGLLDRFGTAGFVAVKAGVTLLVLQNYAAISRDLLAAVDAITCGAAAHNAYVIGRLPARD